jgi:hypothetical protein
VKAQEEQRRGERAQQSSRYRSLQRRRKTEIHDRWIPFKFPERPTAVRSAEAAREISLGSKKRSPDTRSCHRDISHREIGVLKVVRTGTLKVSISRHNRDRPFGRTRGSDRAPPGEARQEASSENRESEFHESREQLQQKPRNRDERNPD